LFSKYNNLDQTFCILLVIKDSRSAEDGAWQRCQGFSEGVNIVPSILCALVYQIPLQSNDV
jgi:hypothetical protein